MTASRSHTDEPGASGTFRPAAFVENGSSPQALPWVAIQRNRRSGAGRQYGVMMELIRELARLGYRPRLFRSRETLDAAVHATGRQAPYAVVAAGGDGTVLDMLNRHPALPTAILPLGTENLLARYLGIPARNGLAVARMIAAGRTRQIDLGRIGERRFCVMASCGFDSEVIRIAHELRQGSITRWHYVSPIASSFRSYRFPLVHAYIDGAAKPVSGGLIVVANLPQYALGLPLAPMARANDGQLDIRVFPHRSRTGLLWDLHRLLLRSPERAASIPHFQGTSVRLEADEPLMIQADGDPIALTPVEISIDRAAARLFVPPANHPVH